MLELESIADNFPEAALLPSTQNFRHQLFNAIDQKRQSGGHGRR
jgi:hypothetical protein